MLKKVTCGFCLLAILVTLVQMMYDIFIKKLYNPFGTIFLILIALIIILAIIIDGATGKVNKFIGNAIIACFIGIALIITYSMVREMFMNPIVMVIWVLTHIGLIYSIGK